MRAHHFELPSSWPAYEAATCRCRVLLATRGRGRGTARPERLSAAPSGQLTNTFALARLLARLLVLACGGCDSGGGRVTHCAKLSLQLSSVLSCFRLSRVPLPIMSLVCFALLGLKVCAPRRISQEEGGDGGGRESHRSCVNGTLGRAASARKHTHEREEAPNFRPSSPPTLALFIFSLGERSQKSVHTLRAEKVRRGPARGSSLILSRGATRLDFCVREPQAPRAGTQTHKTRASGPSGARPLELNIQ